MVWYCVVIFLKQDDADQLECVIGYATSLYLVMGRTPEDQANQTFSSKSENPDLTKISRFSNLSYINYINLCDLEEIMAHTRYDVRSVHWNMKMSFHISWLIGNKLYHANSEYFRQEQEHQRSV